MFILNISKFFLILSLFSVVIITPFNIFPFVVGKILFFRLCIELALLFFIWSYTFRSTIHDREWLTVIFKFPIVTAVTFFVFIFSLAGFLGYDPVVSFWSNFIRGEGVFQMWHYYIFFLLAIYFFKDEKSWRQVSYYFLVASFLTIILGIPTWIRDYHLDSRFKGTIGNPAFLATYLFFTLFFGFYLLKEKFQSSEGNLPNIWKVTFRRWILFGICFLAFGALFLTGTRGAFLGLVAGVFAALFTVILRSLKAAKIISKRFFTPFRITVSLFFIGLMIAFFYYQPARIFQISFKEHTAQTRFWTWGSAIKGWQDSPILGWGSENFSAVFDKYFDMRHYDSPDKGLLPNTHFDDFEKFSSASRTKKDEELSRHTSESFFERRVENFSKGQNMVFGSRPSDPEVWFDRAHNIFVDYLAETGLLGLLAYLGIWIIYYLQLFKKKSLVLNSKSLILFASFPIAYLVQGSLLFETLPAYMPLFLFLALANWQFCHSERSEEFQQLKSQIPNPKSQINSKFQFLKFGYWILFVIWCLIFGISSYVGIYRPLVKSVLFNSALSQIDKISSVEEFKNNFSSALDYWAPYGQDEELKMLGGVMLDLFKKNPPPEVAKALADYLNQYYESVLARGRGNMFAENYYILGRVNAAVGNNELMKKYYQEAAIRWPERPEFKM